MSWVKLDDQFSHHPKIMQAGPLAGWLHVCALCYCASYLTDGFVPNGVTNVLADYANIGVTTAGNDMVAFGHDVAPSELVDTLVDVGLWEIVTNGYLIHDYLDYNPSKADVLAERAKNAERQGRYQAKHSRNGVNNGVSNGVKNASVTDAPYPYPSPSPKEEEGGEGAPTSAAWQAFTKARGVNLSASDSEYVAELVTMYGDTATAQAIVYCDKNKRDNFLRMNYIQTVLTSWQAEGTLELHTPEYEAQKPARNGNGRRAEPESVQDKLQRAYALMDAKKGEQDGN